MIVRVYKREENEERISYCHDLYEFITFKRKDKPYAKLPSTIIHSGYGYVGRDK